MTVGAPELSVVVPVRDEEASIAVLAGEIAAALAGLEWEAVWVDDGSRDASRERLRALPAPHRWIALAAPCGQSAALAAGIAAAGGEWVATLDGDGQNDPADLPRLLAHARAGGFDLVNGFRARRRDSALRRCTGWLGNRVRTLCTGRSVRDVGCSARVARRELLAALPVFDGYHRFLPTLLQARGGRLAELPVNHRPRAGGRSKYGTAGRLWRGMFDVVGVRWLLARTRPWRVAGRSGE
jgi:dolichol-phosphate mannosyltransferase